MRKLSPGLQSKIAQRLGLEPILIVGVAWDGRNEALYAEKTLTQRDAWGQSTHVPGKLLEIGGIDDVMNVSGSGSNGSVTVTLDDTDGTIKAIIDRVDVHKAPVTVYQGFADVSDRFTVYWGEVNGPITWDEGKRQLSFAAVTVVEDLEVGFSAEEGQFTNLPDDAIGKVWPLCFGQTRHVPGLTFQKVPTGQIMTNVVVPDRTYQLALAYMSQVEEQAHGDVYMDFFYQAMAHYAGDWDSENYWASKALEDQKIIIANGNAQRQAAMERVNKMRQYLADEENLRSQLIGPVTEGYTVISNNARWWPIGKPFYAKCGDFLLHGTVDDKSVFRFEIIQPPVPVMRPWSETDTTTGKTTSGIGWIVPAWTESDMYVGPDNEIEPVYRGTGGWGPHNIYLQPGERYQDSIEPEGYRVIPAGTPIQIVSDFEMEYVVNIAPTNAVKQVWAYRYQNNVRGLAVVPPEYWRQGTLKTQDPNLAVVDKASFTATTVVLKRPLTGYAFEGWEDGIYVDLDCAVEGKIDAVMRWLIAQYTNRTIDEDAWHPGGNALDDCSFMLAKRGNVLTVLAEMAYQTRHAVFLKNGKFCLEYLSLAPQSDYAITEDDVLAETMLVTCDPTEELVTKIVATYTQDYAVQAESKVIVKSNDLRYGLKVRNDEYYVYRHTESVKQSITFWAIRKSHTWKKLKFKTTLKHLALETYDAVKLRFNGHWVAAGDVTGVVESSVFDPRDNSLELSLWLPIAFGDDAPHPTAWPDSLSEKAWTAYVPQGVEVQPKPAFYANPVKGLVPLIVGDSGGANSPQQSRRDNNHTPAKDASLDCSSSPFPSGYVGYFDEDGTLWSPLEWSRNADGSWNITWYKPWEQAAAPDPPPTRRVHVDRWNYDDVFKKKPPADPGIPLTSGVPARITAYAKDAGYTVEAYPYGLGGKSYTVKNVAALQVAVDMPFPKDTWTFLTKSRSQDGKTSSYYFQPPVWLP